MEGQWGNLSQTLAAIFPIYERQKWDIHGIKYLVCGPASISRYHRLVNCYSAQNLTATVDKEEQAPSIGYAWKQGFGKNDLKFLLLSWEARNKAWDCERETGYVCQCLSVCQDIFSLTHNLQFAGRQGQRDGSIFGLLIYTGTKTRLLEKLI